MPRPDEGLIHTWLDGELDVAEAARVERLVAEDQEWAAAAAEARGLIAASSRILGALDVVPGDVIPSASAPKRHFTVRPWMRMAAGMVLVAGTAYVAREGMRDGDPTRDAPAVQLPVPIAQTTQKSEDDIAEVGASVTEEVSTKAVASADRGTGGAPVRPVIAEPEAPPTRSALALADSEMRERRDLAGQRGAPAAARSAASGAAAAAPLAISRSENLTEATAAKVAVTLTGCWRTETAAPADSVLVNPPVGRQRGDTLVVLVTKDGREATVVRSGTDLLLGTATAADDATVTFRATRTECPSAP